jgi:hypothetical protein
VNGGLPHKPLGSEVSSSEIVFWAMTRWGLEGGHQRFERIKCRNSEVLHSSETLYLLTGLNDHNMNHSFGSRRIFLLICPVFHLKTRNVRYKTVVTYVTLEENWCDIDKSKKTLNVAIHLDRNMQKPERLAKLFTRF